MGQPGWAKVACGVCGSPLVQRGIAMIQSIAGLTLMRTFYRRFHGGGILSHLWVSMLAPGIIHAATPVQGNSSVPQSEPTPALNQPEAAFLKPGTAIERSLTGVETHRYQLKLEK